MTRRTIFALSILLVALLTLLALQTPLLRAARGYTWSFLVHGVGGVFSFGPLTLEKTVQEEIDRLLAENVRLRAQEKAYLRLKEQLGTPAFASYRPIAAEVAARPIDTFHSQLIITKGAAAGVTVGAPVVVHGSTLVGFVAELNEHTAILQLLVHPSTNLTVEVDHERRPRGLLVGRHFTALQVSTIPRDVELAAGQAVVTVGRENLPAGLLVGRISTVEFKENEAYQEAALQLPYDVDQLQAVAILVLP